MKKKENNDPPWPRQGPNSSATCPTCCRGRTAKTSNGRSIRNSGCPSRRRRPLRRRLLVALAIGQREADSASASRPAECPKDGKEEEEKFIECTILKEARVNSSTDLRMKTQGAAPTVQAGSEATLPFLIEVGTTAESIPTFSLSATTNLAGATASVPDSTYKPSAPTDASRRTSASRGQSASSRDCQSRHLQRHPRRQDRRRGHGDADQFPDVTAAPVPPKASLKFGKSKLDKAKGTATLAVQVSSAGTLSASGKKIVGASAKASGPKTINLSIRARGKAKKKLNRAGKVTVKATIAFKPTVGTPVSQVRSLTLKKNLPK